MYIGVKIKSFPEREVMLSFIQNVNMMAGALEALLNPEDVVKP